ncbi:MAG: ParA family protein, partial [Calditrichota bacterium]
MQATIVSFINYKGGVGKTTTTYHVGCSLAYHHKKKVLMIDIDPQTNLTFLCAPHDRWEVFKKKHGTIATIFKRFGNPRQPL